MSRPLRHGVFWSGSRTPSGNGAKDGAVRGPIHGPRPRHHPDFARADSPQASLTPDREHPIGYQGLELAALSWQLGARTEPVASPRKNGEGPLPGRTAKKQAASATGVALLLAEL